MYAVKAIYDGVTFKPTQPVPITEQYEVVITFIEPVKGDGARRKPRCLLEPDPTKVPIIGEFDGLITIPDDFDEPLEEMKEYMY